ncbi:hypothetical protein [Rhodohalobacter sp. 8-1]
MDSFATEPGDFITWESLRSESWRVQKMSFSSFSADGGSFRSE